MAEIIEQKSRIILGMDPGTNIMGYGLIECIGKKVVPITLGVFHLKKYETHELKLQKIFERTSAIIEEYKPDELAIEAPFFGKNVQSMLKLGRAQGVAIAAALNKHLPIFEYAPRQVKQSITGHGDASKEQVAAMLKNILGINLLENEYVDATDALAVALCHSYQNGNIGFSKKKTNKWASFLTENPDRLVK